MPMTASRAASAITPNDPPTIGSPITVALPRTGVQGPTYRPAGTFACPWAQGQAVTNGHGFRAVRSCPLPGSHVQAEAKAFP
jgi:hypothetical protein